ncbi:HD domain-containing phosphohydrolase [Methylophaga sp.]|uniref:HD domain-containing phosphohydrolase n=1 Tax=Methylophaga sp. TaxID=2024840 RepID=UPI003F6A3712
MTRKKFEHDDLLADLNKHLSLREKLISVHQVIKQSLPFIVRISVTIFDPETRVLKTFLDSSDKDVSLNNYEARLDDIHSLKEIYDKGRPRVVNNLLTYAHSERSHSKQLQQGEYEASYTMPMYNHGAFFGLLFFNSSAADVFDRKTLDQLDVFGHMLALMVISELSTIKTLTAAFKTATHIAHLRDPETGSHLDRMSRYSRLIAKSLADKYKLSDDYIEHVFMYAPLHDIGKIAIPDHILLKPSKLNETEMEIMKTHTIKGREMIDDILCNFGLKGIAHVDIVRNIAEFHHETINGMGYPSGMTGDEIPLEAKIIAVADIFDALTSERPYKKAWTNDKALAKLQELAGESIDQDCVNALNDNIEQVQDIQRYFQESLYS